MHLTVGWLLGTGERNRYFSSCCCSVAKSCLTLSTPVDCSMLGFPVLHYLWSLLKCISVDLMMSSNHLIFCQTPSPPALNLSQHQGLFQWVGSSNQVAQVLELQPQDQSFQLIFRADFLWDRVFDLLAVQRKFKSLLQYYNLKASIVWHSAFLVEEGMAECNHWNTWTMTFK